MKNWEGAAAICIKEQKLLMVLQGAPGETLLWTVPSGGLETGETPEACCVREIWEETGYHAVVSRKLREKRGTYSGYAVLVHYFAVELTEGEPQLHDPDGFIYEIAWKTAAELQQLPLSFPEDRDFLLNYLQQTKESSH